MTRCSTCDHARRDRGSAFRRCAAKAIDLPPDGYDVCTLYKPDFAHDMDFINPNDTALLIYAAYEKADGGSREYLGMSEIGAPCDRALWYSFRHVKQRKFPGRMLRLFNTGHREEDRVADDLRRIGCEVHTHEPNGQQFEFIGYKGHVKGHMDGALVNLPLAPKTWHVLEAKTHNDDSFKELKNKGVELAKPQHWAQMQEYMGHSKMDRALYFAVDKDTDEIYTERVHFNKAAFEKLEARAAKIIDAPEPLQRISNDPAWWQCKLCDYRDICWEGKTALANCRTCVRSTPIEGGKWSCEKHGTAVAMCGDHLYIPAILQVSTIDAAEHFIAYEGFNNITEASDKGDAWQGMLVHTSKQIEDAGHVSMLGDPGYYALRGIK